jgi:hypothetical protein
MNYLQKGCKERITRNFIKENYDKGSDKMISGLIGF